MQISDKGLALLKLSEGWRDHVYNDVAAFQTIGYGHRLTPAEIANETFKNGIDLVMGEKLLDADVAVAENAVNRFVHAPLTQGQFDALVDFTFNLGSSRLRNSTMLARLNEGQYDTAANLLLEWDHGVVNGKLEELPGLEARRRAEYALWYSQS